MISDSDYRVAVLGLGYIGLPTAAVIARTGAKVLGVDVTQSVVDTVNSGKVHIEEVDLDGLVSGVVARGDLRASMLIEPADVFVIAVPTPFDDDHQPNIGYVLRAATTVAAVLKAGDRHDRKGRRTARAAAPRPEDTRPVRRQPRRRRRLLPRTRTARAHPDRADRQ